MLRDDFQSAAHRPEFVDGGDLSKDSRRSLKSLHARWQAESCVHRWHGLATVLAMMPVGRALHGTAALHRLLRRCQGIAFQGIPPKRERQQGQKDSSGEMHSKQIRSHEYVSQGGASRREAVRAQHRFFGFKNGPNSIFLTDTLVTPRPRLTHW
jgi:hypothetical protein